MTLFYISFASKTEFLGATIVEARDQRQAVEIAALIGVNPGGEAMILDVPLDQYETGFTARLLNSLVGRDELMRLGGVRWGDLTPKDKADFNVSKAHEDCNPVRR